MSSNILRRYENKRKPPYYLNLEMFSLVAMIFSSYEKQNKRRNFLSNKRNDSPVKANQIIIFLGKMLNIILSFQVCDRNYKDN